MQESLEALRLEIGAEVATRDSNRDSQDQLSLATFTERVEAVASTVGANRSELETVVRTLSERLELLEQASEKLRVDVDTSLETQVGALKSCMESSHHGFRQALEASEKSAGDSSNVLVSELRAMRNHSDSRLESHARSAAESSKQLDSELREMVHDATERAELAAANLDSKVAGALDAVMDARVARGAKECGDEVFAARASLEARLRASEASTERFVKEEMQTMQTTLKTLHKPDPAPEFLSLRKELQDVRKMTESFSSHLQESAEDLLSMSSSQQRLSADVRRMQANSGSSHEWCIPRCLHRIRYLSMSTEAGLWLDSDPFELGTMGPLTLRLYPRGVRGGDGQCAVGLRMAKDVLAACGPYALPTCLDLSVGTLRSRAQQKPDVDGAGVIWLAEGLSDVEGHAAKGGDDLRVSVEAPQLQVVPLGSVDAAAGLNELLHDGVAESMTVPQELKTALLQRRSVDQDAPASFEPDRGYQLASICEGGHLLSQDTLGNEDLASTVTVGSDANITSSRPRPQCNVDGGELKRGVPRSGSEPPGSPNATTQSGLSAPATSSPVQHPANVRGGGDGQPSGIFAVQSTWTQPLGRNMDSPSGRLLVSGFGAPSSAFSSSASSAHGNSGAAVVATTSGLQSSSVLGRTNPFDVTNPFDTSFQEATPYDSQPYSSPTPSFATPPDGIAGGNASSASAPGVARLRGEVPRVSPV